MSTTDAPSDSRQAAMQMVIRIGPQLLHENQGGSSPIVGQGHFSSSSFFSFSGLQKYTQYTKRVAKVT
jgi:hypothetical protein